MTSVELLAHNLGWYLTQANAYPSKKEVFGNQAFGAVMMWIDLHPEQEEYASKMWDNYRNKFGF